MLSDPAIKTTRVANPECIGRLPAIVRELEHSLLLVRDPFFRRVLYLSSQLL